MRARFASLLLVAATACTGAAVGPFEPAGVADFSAIAVWSSRTLPTPLVRTVQGLEGVSAVGQVARGTLDLVSVSGADRPLPPRPRGAILPVSVTGLDPRPLRASDVLPELTEALGRGEAALTMTSARLRGMSPGDRLTLAGRGMRRTYRVGAIVPESDLLSAEVFVPLADALALGANPRRALALAVDTRRYFEVYDRIEDAIAGLPAGIRSVEGNENETTVLPLAEVKRIFGEFWFAPTPGRAIRIDPAWVTANIVERDLPLLGTTRCNRRVVAQLEGAMREVIARGLAHVVRNDSGCYFPRTQVSDVAAISRHAYGIAVDINADRNPYASPPTQDPRLVEVMEKWGFSWGGRWLVPDGMHFEWVRSA